MNTDNRLNSPSKKVTKSIKVEILFFGKYFLLLSILFSFVWILGYLQINVLWGLIGIFTFVIYKRMICKQRQKFNFSVDLCKDLKFTLDNVPGLPSWVSFPDVERVEWINKIISRLWPHVTIYLNKMIQQKFLKELQKKLKDLNIKEIHFGDVSPKIGGVKIYNSENIAREEVIMDLDIYYCSPTEITFLYSQLQLGIKNFEIAINMRIQLNYLIPVIPFFGEISFTLLRNPHIHFEFTDMISFLNIPGVRSLLRERIDDIIADLMVLPNRINIIIKKDIPKSKFSIHIPDGVMRIHVIEAASLKAMDVRLLDHNTSDPYMIIRVGAQKFKTKVINSCLNPKWNETFEAIVDTKSLQKVELQLFDKDKNNKDDFLGKVSFDTEDVYDRGVYDAWLQLEDIDTGSVHLNLTWLELSADPTIFDLEADRVQNSDSRSNVGLLYILLDSAKNLSKLLSHEDPSPMVKISLGNEVKFSSVVKKTTNPVWEKPYYFLIQSLLSNTLNIQVKDDKSKKLLGNCFFKVEKLLSEPNMEGFLALKLENTNGVDSTIQFYATLRALKVKTCRTSNYSRFSTLKMSETDYVSTNGTHINNNDEQGIPQIVEPIPENVFEDSSNQQLDSPNDKQSLNIFKESPMVYLTLRYTTNKNMLIIVIHKVKNLSTNHGLYVKLSLLPKDNRNGKHRTKSIRSQDIFVYDETFELFYNKETLQISELVLKFNMDRYSLLKRKNNIGQAKIDLSELSATNIKSEWFPINVSKSVRSSDTQSLRSNQSTGH